MPEVSVVWILTMLRVLYFTADWCGPCKVFGPRLNQFADSNDIRVDRVNVDEFPDIAQKYDVMSLPTTIWLRDEEFQTTLVGPADESKLSQTLFTARGN